MKKTAVLEHFGGLYPLADALGISRQAVEQWPELIPRGRAYELQVLTAGKLRVDPKLYRVRGASAHD